MIDSLFGPQKC